MLSSAPDKSWRFTEAVPADWELSDISAKNSADVREERDQISFDHGDYDNNYSYGSPFSALDNFLRRTWSPLKRKLRFCRQTCRNSSTQTGTAGLPVLSVEKKEQEEALEIIMTTLEAAKERAKLISAALAVTEACPGVSPSSAE